MVYAAFLCCTPSFAQVATDSNSYAIVTNQGTIYIELRPDAAPRNVENFLAYVNSGAYKQSFFHRLVPGFVLQGGGYFVDTSGAFEAIAQNSPVINEFSLSNVAGTMAMAKLSNNPNSATNQFFFNLADNSSILDQQDGGFTVFADVTSFVGYPADSLTVLATMASDQINPSGLTSPFDQIPVITYDAAKGLQSADLITISAISRVTSSSSVSATSLVFPATTVGSTSAAKSITLKNSGDASIVIKSIALTGGQADDFSESTTCDATLGAGKSCTISASFAPASAGSKASTITIIDNASSAPQTIALRGSGTATGTVPVVSLSASSLTFSNQAVGTSSAAINLTLSNAGKASLSLSSIALTGGQADDFALSKTCGGSLGANSSCSITIEFKPVSTGAKTASVSIVDNAKGSPQIVALSGTGVGATGAAAIRISPVSLSFPGQTVGTASTARTVTLTNSGTAPISLKSIALAGGQADDFALSKTSPSTLAPNTSCTVSVSFKPVSSGTKLASVQVTDDAVGSPQTISLTGHGT